jgi:hypothetical protein
VETFRLERVKKSKSAFSGLQKIFQASEIVAHIALYCVSSWHEWGEVFAS